MTKAQSPGRPAWSVHPPDIRRALKTAISRCYAVIGEARKSGNQPVAEAFRGVLDKIKEADLAVKEARAIYAGTDVSQEEIES